MASDRGARRHRALRVALAAVLAVTTAVALVRPDASPASADPGSLGAGGEYHPIPPELLVGPTELPVQSGTRVEADAVALAGVPDDPSAVLALALNITVSASDVDGDLVAYSSDIGRVPRTSSLTFSKGRPTSALVVASPGADGRLSISLTPHGTGAGTASVRATVIGWFSTSSAPESGARIITRAMRGIHSSTFTAGQISTIPVAGRAGVPTGPSVEAVVLNVTGRSASQNTGITLGAGADDMAARSAQTLSIKKRETTTSMVAIVPLADDGSITVRNRAGQVDVALHVVGFVRTGLDPATSIGRLVPLDRPFRAVDTTTPRDQARPIAPGAADPWGFEPFVGELAYVGTGDPVGPVSGFVGAFAAHSHRRQYPTNPPSTTQLKVYPDGRRLPPAPNLTLGEGQMRSTTVVSALSADDVVKVYNKAGTTHYRIDVSAVLLG